MAPDLSMWNNYFSRNNGIQPNPDIIKKCGKYQPHGFILILILIPSQIFAQQDNSYFFIPSGDYVECVVDQSQGAEQNLEPTAGMTLEFWVKPPLDEDPENFVGIINYMTLSGPDNEAGFAFIFYEGLWRFMLCAANETDIWGNGLQNWPGIELDDNVWEHVACTYNGSEVSVYLNGEIQQTLTIGGGAIQWADIDKKLDIGKGIGYGGPPNNYYFQGAIDEVRVWSMARNEAEIQSTMNQVIGAEDGLEAYWNFNDNQSTDVTDLTGNGYPGTLYEDGNGYWFDDVFAAGETGACCEGEDCSEETQADCEATGGTYQGDGTDCSGNPCASGPCFDEEITEADFPYSHLADLTIEDDDWDQSYFPYPAGGEQGNTANGADYTYKLTLSEPAVIYVTTCDELTTVDVQIGIYTEECDEASWIFFQDDSNSDIYYPDGTTDQYNFECISGYESAPTYANMLPQIVWDPGTYYIVVDDRAGTPGWGSVRTWIGYSLLVDTTYTSGDFTEVSYIFSEGVFGGEYQDVYYGNGTGLDAEDWTFSINPNGGAANDVNMTSLTSATGGTLVGGEETVILNFEYPTTPSGGEILTVGPASVSSIFNSVGVPLLDVDGTPIELVDALAPTVESTTPQNGESGVSSVTNITVRFTEAVLNSVDGENITNSNATDCFILEEAVSGDDISFTITSGDQIEFEINPDPPGGQLPENTAIRLSMLATIEDEAGNGFAFDTLRFVTADESPPQINSSTISSINDYVAITFSEGVYSSAGFSSAPDLTYMGEFGGHKYYGSNYPLTWTDASDYLDGFEGAHLVTISSQAENDFVSGEWAIGWIGFNDIVEEGNWVWVTGEEVTYTNWAPGEPNNAGEEHYGEIYSDGTWNDLPNDLKTFIAEVEESGSTGGLELSDLTYIFNSNGGNCENVTVVGLTNTAGEALTGGETTIHALLSLGGAPSGVETITFSPVNNSSIYDYAGNTMNSSVVSEEVTLLASALLISTDLADSNVYVDLGFSTGIYGNAYQSMPVYLAAFESILETNDGTATNITLTSVTDLENNALVGGEDSIRIHMSFNELPSGVERVSLSPATNFSIYSISGVPVPESEIYGPIILNDEYPPIGMDDIEEGETNVSEMDTITISFNENIYIPETGNQVTEGDLVPSITLAYGDADGESIPFLIELVNDPPVITLYPAVGYNSEATVYYAFNAQFQDVNENPETYIFEATFTVRDYIPPVFQSTSLSPLNSYVAIEFDEPVYANSNGTGGLSLGNIDYYFNANGGNCEELTVSQLTKENGTALTGGETTIRAVLDLNCSASGVETIHFGPSDDPIYDAVGNAMSSDDVSGAVTLYESAYIENHTLADSNEFIDLYFSVGVYGNSTQTQPLYLSAFTVALQTNEGSATTVTPTSLTDTVNTPLTGGESTIRLHMSFDNFPSGEETIVILPTTAYSIYSYSGIPVPTSEVSDSILLNDQLPPMGDDNIVNGTTDVDQGDSLTLTFTEDLYLPQTGDIATEADLASFVTLKEDSSTGIDIPFTLSMVGSPPTLIINPVEDYPSETTVYYAFNAVLADVNGNSVEINFAASFTIRDYLAPVVVSSVLALDNSYLDIIFDEEIYGTNQESGAVGNNVIQLEFFDNGSVTDTVIITSLTRTDSNFLIGGETMVRMNLEYNSTPSGNESMVASVISGVEIYDDAGNQMTAQTLTDTIQLYDILPPSVDTMSVPIDSFIVLMENTPITFSFNEPINSLEFTVTAVVAESVNFDTIRTDSTIKVTLQPPFTSFDSITVYFSHLEDYAGLTTVDIAYTYVTPLLGDYDLDSTLSYEDLWDLVTNWKDKNYNYELAPVTGEAPHFVATPDSKFDIEDGMAFVRMWSWYQKTYGTIREETEAVGRPLELIQNNDNLFIVLNEDVSGGQFSFSYDIGENPIQFNHRQNKEHEYFLTNHSPELGYSIMEFARSGELAADTISINLNAELKDISLFYQLINDEKQIVQKGTVNVNGTNLPTKMALYPAYPNPFNPTTTIRFDIPENEIQNSVTLNIYDLRGRLVETLAKGAMLPGRYSMKWHANQYASGMYFARLVYGEKVKTQKILLLK